MDASETAREALRQATAATHARVEAVLGLGAPDVTWEMYHAALAALARAYGAVAAWLPEAVRQAAAGPCARLEVHLQRLHADLAYVRAQGGLPQIATGGRAAIAPPVPPPPAEWGAAHGFGMLYVVEGSTLGGQYVARHLTGRRGLGPSQGLTFFHGDGPETGRLWRAFRADLGQHVVTDAAVARAVAGAQWAFAAVLAAHATSGR